MKATTTKKASSAPTSTPAAKPETLKYRIEFPDGTVTEGETMIRPFQANIAKNFQNTGFQTKIVSGLYSGSLMIIDGAKRKQL